MARWIAIVVFATYGSLKSRLKAFQASIVRDIARIITPDHLKVLIACRSRTRPEGALCFLPLRIVSISVNL